MPKKKHKLWSVPRIQDPRYPGRTVRVTELTKGGILYLVYRGANGRRQEMRSLRLRRCNLGNTPAEQQRGARRKGFEAIEKWATHTETDDNIPQEEHLTVEELVDLYEKEGLHKVSLVYGRNQLAALRRFSRFIDPERPVVSLCQSHLDRFSTHRRKVVTANTVAGDLTALKIAVNFALGHKRKNGQPVLTTNPLARVRLKRGKVRTPWVSPERYQKLLAVAGELPPAFRPVLVLAWETGRRIGAILKLRWEDVLFESKRAASLATDVNSDNGTEWKPSHFPAGGVHWYANVEPDNKKYPHVAALNARAREALESWRAKQCPGIATAWVFPAPTDTRNAMGYHLPNQWLRRAEKLAGLEHSDRGGWHALRRGWTTLRKHLPVKDVMAAGAWRTAPPVLNSYMQSDPDTTLAVINGG